MERRIDDNSNSDRQEWSEPIPEMTMRRCRDICRLLGHSLWVQNDCVNNTWAHMSCLVSLSDFQQWYVCIRPEGSLEKCAQMAVFEAASREGRLDFLEKRVLLNW